jgi:hypothetical protein
LTSEVGSPNFAVKGGKISSRICPTGLKVKPDVAASVLEDLFRRGLLVRVSNDVFEPDYASPGDLLPRPTARDHLQELTTASLRVAKI